VECGALESLPQTPGERRRAAEDAAMRRRKMSVAIGAVGLALLFGGAIASLFLSSFAYLPFISLEVVGLALIVVSFARLKRPAPGILRTPEK
jgi:hypothetical protein